MRFIKLALAAILCVPVLFFCACFSMGVEDLTEYNSRFPHVYSVKWDFSCTTTDMSEFVGEEDVEDSSSDDGSDDSDLDSEYLSDDSSEEDSSDDSDSSDDDDEDKSTLVAVVDSAAYRAIAVEAGDSETYPSSTISELNIYFYYSGEADVELSFGIFVSDSLPQDNQSYYTMSDFTSTQGDLYTDGDIVQPISSSDMVETGSLTLTKEGEDENDKDDENYGWSAIYLEFDTAITVKSGQYLVIVFFENNDYVVNITEVTDDSSSDSTGTDSTGTDSTGTDSTGTDSTGTDSTGTDSTGTSSTGADSTGTDSSSTTKYKYTFTQYSDNDASFSFDKVLLYVNDNE